MDGADDPSPNRDKCSGADYPSVTHPYARVEQRVAAGGEWVLSYMGGLCTFCAFRFLHVRRPSLPPVFSLFLFIFYFIAQIGSIRSNMCIRLPPRPGGT